MRVAALSLLFVPLLSLSPARADEEVFLRKTSSPANHLNGSQQDNGHPVGLSLMNLRKENLVYVQARARYWQRHLKDIGYSNPFREIKQALSDAFGLRGKSIDNETILQRLQTSGSRFASMPPISQQELWDLASRNYLQSFHQLEQMLLDGVEGVDLERQKFLFGFYSRILDDPKEEEISYKEEDLKRRELRSR